MQVEAGLLRDALRSPLVFESLSATPLGELLRPAGDGSEALDVLASSPNPWGTFAEASTSSGLRWEQENLSYLLPHLPQHPGRSGTTCKYKLPQNKEGPHEGERRAAVCGPTVRGSRRLPSP